MKAIEFKSIKDNSYLVTDSILKLSQSLQEAQRPLVGEIDPQYMGGKELCEQYGVDPSEGANCVIVEATMIDKKDFVAVVYPVGYRADLNGIVRKHLNAKKVSLAPLEEVIKETGMEYGSITPFGLPESWKILVDKKLTEKEKIVVGGGKQISKLLLPLDTLCNISNVQVIEGLSKQK